MAIREPNQDLFAGSRMSFGEHLEELRKVLIRCAISVALGSIVGFIFADRVVDYLKTPLEKAMADYQHAIDLKRLAEADGFVDPELLPWMKENNLSPKTVYIDPGQMVQMLREVSPDFLEGVNLNPYGFRAGSFDSSQIDELCESWVEDKDEESSRGKRLKWMWDQLTPTSQNSIESIANRQSDDDEASDDDIRAVTQAFNTLAGKEDLYSAEGFAELCLPPETTFWSWLTPPEENPLTAIVDKLDEKSDPDLNMRLNRVLISAQFAEFMPAAKTELVAIQMWQNINVQPQSLQAMEPFMIWLKAGVVTGFVIASPLVFYWLWSFVAAGLYPHEKNYVYIFLPISLGLFISGACLAFFFVFKPVLAFLFTFNQTMGITPQLRINEWMNFVMFLPVGFGIAFQLPLVMLFLNRIGVFSVSNYLSKWRIAIMVIFVTSMLLTPSDPISMILLALPLTALYFLGVAMCQWLPRQQNPFGEEAAAAAE
ncbi:MAG: twin-arginine translocase subunit TatC [Planctomycetota bacterium]